jgi:hypothetical protein
MSSEACSEEDDSRRFDVELFVIHPTLRPDDISQVLTLDAHFSKTVGEPRATPSGTPLSGTYRDTRWRHGVRNTVQDQHFADQLANFVESLKSRRKALVMLRASGGQTMLIVQFLGDGYLGDEISHETLSNIVELGLGLGIECFVVPQGEG